MESLLSTGPTPSSLATIGSKGEGGLLNSPVIKISTLFYFLIIIFHLESLVPYGLTKVVVQIAIWKFKSSCP